MLRGGSRLIMGLTSKPALASRTTMRAVSSAVLMGGEESHPTSDYTKVLRYDSIAHAVKNAEYAVRGEIPIRAEQLKATLRKTPDALPFKKVIHCNIGNPQELNQKPITYLRQVMALVEYPDLLAPENRDWLTQKFPIDVIERAESYIKSGLTSAGAYTHSQGLPFVRENVAQFISERDGFPAEPENIFLTNGASGGVQMLCQIICAHPKAGIMIPIPQYPLYSATMSMVNGIGVPYYLNEEDGWSMSVAELKKSLSNAELLGVDVRAMVIINPGNPTGQCLTEQNIREIIDFCHREHIVLMADEVYQTNIYNDKLPFHSFRKVLKSMGPKYDDVELISFHSTSKGFIGECGKRGGYFEVTGILDEVKNEIYKAASIQLCSNVTGQIATDIMVRPPREGESSYKQYCQERDNIISSLQRRAQMLVNAFNQLEGVTCNPSEGAMYAFPRIRLPKKAIMAARKDGHQPDAFYCLKMLERTGVCTVPGSGFRQANGTFHFRATFLPPEKEFPEFVKLINDFHEEFMNEYRD